MGSTKLRKRGSNLDKMTDKERRFVHEYPIDYNGVRAVIAAGYSEKTAAVIACVLLKKPHIAAAIGKLEREMLESVKLRREEALLQLFYLATRKASDFVNERGEILPIPEMNERAQACIDGLDQEVHIDSETGDRTIRTKLKLSPKASGVDMLLRHKGLFAPVDNNVNVNLGQVLAALMGQIENSNVIDGQVIENKLESEK